MSGDERQRPVLKLVRGSATDEEIAALVTVLASLGGGPGRPAKPKPAEWSDHHRKVRVSLPHGPGGWRSSGMPH